MSSEEPQTHALRQTVLVVDDEILIRLMISEELRGAGFSVVEATNADEALAILQTTTPVDLVMTDVRMPGSIDGLGLAATVRSQWPQLKIIIASAHTLSVPGPDLTDGFFGKPYDPARVVKRVKELLAENGR